MLRLFVLILLLGGLPGTAFSEVRIIELKNRPASEVVEKVRELLDEDEKVTDAGNHLLLIADGESLQAASQLIELLDKQLSMLVVRLQNAESRHKLAEEFSGGLSYSNRHQLSGAGTGSHLRGNSSRHAEQMLKVLEGEGGWLQVGKDIPYTEEWAVLAGENSGYSERINYKTIAVGFWVRPVKVLGDEVMVDVEPRFSRLSGGQSDPPEIRFSASSTRLQLPLGQWHPLSSSFQQENLVSRAIVHWRTDSGETEEEVFIRIDRDKGFYP